MHIFTVSLFGHRKIYHVFKLEKKLSEIIAELIKTKDYVAFLAVALAKQASICDANAPLDMFAFSELDMPRCCSARYALSGVKTRRVATIVVCDNISNLP